MLLGSKLGYLLYWEVEIWYATHPDLNLLLCAVAPGVGPGVKMYNRLDFTLTSIFLLEVITWVPFMLGSLKFGMLLTQI